MWIWGGLCLVWPASRFYPYCVAKWTPEVGHHDCVKSALTPGSSWAPVDQRPQLETGLRGDQCLLVGQYGHGGPTLVTEVSLCICSVDLYTFTQLCNLESAGSTAAVPSVLFEVPWYFFLAMKHSSKSSGCAPDRLQRSCLHSTEFEVCESPCERLFVCSQVILQDAGKEVTSDENVSQSRDTKQNVFGQFLSVWLFQINVLYPPYFSCKSGRGHLYILCVRLGWVLTAMQLVIFYKLCPDEIRKVTEWNIFLFFVIGPPTLPSSQFVTKHPQWPRTNITFF